MISYKRLLISILILPFSAVAIIPAILLFLDDQGRMIWLLKSPWWIIGLIFSGLLIISGLVLLVQTNHLFLRMGQGTLAPWDPPQSLVTAGPYRYVRNPMILGVFFLMLGEAILFWSGAIFIWLLVFLLLNLIYIPFVEESVMQNRFGKEFDVFKENVPAWIPRLNPWQSEIEKSPINHSNSGSKDECK